MALPDAALYIVINRAARGQLLPRQQLHMGGTLRRGTCSGARSAAVRRLGAEIVFEHTWLLNPHR